jgi:RNA polymerase sigma-70 factor (sigma-E family)
LLTGDWPAAEDLVQSALVATWRRWQGSGPIENPRAYVQRVAVTEFLRLSKRRWLGEVATDPLPDLLVQDDPFADFDTHQAVRTVLQTLPARQRAVVVLRYFADLSEAQTATAMGCAIGTVKSQSAKALARLHEMPELAELLSEGGVS